MRFTDGARILEITMRMWDGTRWWQDISGEMLAEPGMQYSAAHDAYICDDIDYVIDYAKDWKDGTGDFAEQGVGENGDYFVEIHAAQ